MPFITPPHPMPIVRDYIDPARSLPVGGGGGGTPSNSEPTTGQIWPR